MALYIQMGFARNYQLFGVAEAKAKSKAVHVQLMGVEHFEQFYMNLGPEET